MAGVGAAFQSAGPQGPPIMFMCQESMAGVRKTTEKTRSRSQPNVRKTSSCQCERPRNKESSKCKRLFRTSLKQLQVKIEAENQQVQETMQLLLDAEKRFLKELECVLTQWEVAELRRKELLHKRWTGVWSPLQRRVEEHVSSCSRRQSLCHLRHSKSKRFVSLDTYDSQEYRHFLLNVKKLQYFKLKTNDLNDTSHLQLQEKNQEKENILLL